MAFVLKHLSFPSLPCVYGFIYLFLFQLARAELLPKSICFPLHFNLQPLLVILLLWILREKTFTTCDYWTHGNQSFLTWHRGVIIEPVAPWEGHSMFNKLWQVSFNPLEPGPLDGSEKTNVEALGLAMWFTCFFLSLSFAFLLLNSGLFLSSALGG